MKHFGAVVYDCYKMELFVVSYVLNKVCKINIESGEASSDYIIRREISEKAHFNMDAICYDIWVNRL